LPNMLLKNDTKIQNFFCHCKLPGLSGPASRHPLLSCHQLI
jgi:hypothetical protein